MKKSYLDFIKEYETLSLVKICKKLKVNKQNLKNGKASLENTIKVADEIKKDLNNLLEKGVK